jgi:uncharacterized protein (TIGR02246 family)
MTSRPVLIGLLAATGALAALACARPQPPGQAIQEANARFVEAFKRQDAVAIAAEYAEDAVVLPPDGPAVQGRTAIQGFFGGLFTAGGRDLTLETLDLYAAGERAIERGAFTLTMRPEGGQPTILTGKNVVIWTQQSDRAWKVSIDIFNFDARPTPDAGPHGAPPAGTSGPGASPPRP